MKMVVLTNSDNLEIGGLAGKRHDEVFVRTFEIVNGDTVMSRTHIAFGNKTGFNLIATFDVELVDIMYIPDIGLVCMDGTGHLYRYSGGAWTDLKSAIEPSTRVSTLRRIDNEFYALGPHNGLYRSSEATNWQKVQIEDSGAHILDLVKAPDGNRFICGTEGYLARLGESGATRVELPTDVHLVGLLAVGSKLFVCGHAATLFVSDGEEWTFLGQEGAEDDYLKLLQYGSDVLIAAEFQILKVGVEGISTFADVDAEKLYLIGDRLFTKTSRSINYLIDGSWHGLPVEFEVSGNPSATAVERN